MLSLFVLHALPTRPTERQRSTDRTMGLIEQMATDLGGVCRYEKDSTGLVAVDLCIPTRVSTGIRVRQFGPNPQHARAYTRDHNGAGLSRGCGSPSNESQWVGQSVASHSSQSMRQGAI